MTQIERELQDFQQFALQQVPNLPADITFDDVVDLWKREHGNRWQADDLEPIREAVDDFKSGDRGTPAGVLSQHLRQKLNGGR